MKTVKAIFIDMDDVLCDFHSAYAQMIHPEKPEFSIEQWDKYKYLMDSHFFAELKPMPWFDSLKKTVMQHEFFIITSAELGEHIAGKIEWLRRQWPEAIETYPRRLIIAQAKYLCSGPGRLLIDDYWKNIIQWKDHGGDTVYVPAPHHTDYHERIAEFDMERELHKWIQSTE